MTKHLTEVALTRQHTQMDTSVWLRELPYCVTPQGAVWEQKFTMTPPQQGEITRDACVCVCVKGMD